MIIYYGEEKKKRIIKNKTMGRRRSKLKDYEGYKITFQYDGPDHPNSKIGSQKITGTIIHVGIDTFKINI